MSNTASRDHLDRRVLAVAIFGGLVAAARYLDAWALLAS